MPPRAIDTGTSLADRHPLVIATSVYVLIAVALTGPALIGRATLAPDRLLDWDLLYRIEARPHLPMMSDPSPTVLDYPKDLSFAGGLRGGRIDLWNPLVAAGAPLWAEHSGPFFPLKLPFYLNPSRQTYDWFIALRLVTAAVGAYLLARVRSQQPIPALAAGATFEVSGAMLAPLPFGNTSAVYMLPWVILGSFVIAQTRTPRAAVGAGIPLGVAGSGGHPTLIFMVFAAFSVAMAGHLIVARGQLRTRVCIAASAMVAVVLALILAAASLLPLAELATVGISYKNRPIVAEQTHDWSLRLSRSLPSQTLFASRVLGTLPAVASQANLSPSIGALALFAAITGLIGGRLGLPLLGVALLGVGWALAPPGSAGAFQLPGLRLVLPMYAWPLIALPATQSVGDGITALTRPGEWWRGAMALALFIGVGVAVHPEAVRVDYSPLTALVPGWTLPAVVAGVALSVSILFRRAGLGQYAAATLAAAMIGEQLWTMMPFNLHPVSKALQGPPSPAVQFLQSRVSGGDARVAGLSLLVGIPLSPMLVSLPDLRNVSALPVRRYFDYMQAITPEMSIFTVLAAAKTKSPLLDLAAVRYLVAPVLGVPPQPMPNDPSLPRVYEDAYVVVYENPSAFPRVRLVHAAVRLPDEAAARRWAQTLGQLPKTAAELGLASVVLVERDENGVEAPAVSGVGSERENVRIAKQGDPDRLLISAYLESPGLVVVADTYYPGWRAWVDGQETPIFPTNLLFRAIYVPAGAHTVEFRYEPKSFFYGVLLSSLGVAASLLVILRYANAHRAAEPRAEPTPVV